MLREPFAHFRVFVSGVVVNDRIDHLSLGKMRVDVIEETDELLCRWRFMLRLMMVPSRTLRAANDVVVPLRLSSWVIVPARPRFIDSPGWVRSRAWILLFSSTERTTAWAGGLM